MLESSDFEHPTCLSRDAELQGLRFGVTTGLNSAPGGWSHARGPRGRVGKLGIFSHTFGYYSMCTRRGTGTAFLFGESRFSADQPISRCKPSLAPMSVVTLPLIDTSTHDAVPSLMVIPSATKCVAPMQRSAQASRPQGPPRLSAPSFPLMIIRRHGIASQGCH